MGAGPFFRIDHLRFRQYSYRGTASDPEVSIAMGNSGAVQIELIELHDTAESLFQDFARSGGRGPQHYSVWASDYDAQLAHIAELGLDVLAEGRTPTARSCFVASTPLIGCDLEILEYEPGVRAMMEDIAIASDGWDGVNPVRTIRR